METVSRAMRHREKSRNGDIGVGAVSEILRSNCWLLLEERIF